MDKLRAMGLFCRAVEAKSFAAAARSLDIVPSVLSKAIAGLEEQLGAKLMNRSTRRLSLTEQGAAYYEHCHRMLEELESVEESCREAQVRPRGTLRIGMHPGFRFCALHAMGRFLDSYPDLKVETVMTNSPAAIFEDGLDLVLHIGQLADSSLISRRLGWTRPVTCASAGYLAAWGEPHRPGDLAQHRAIVYGRPDEDRNTRWLFVKGSQRESVEVPVCLVSRDGIGLVDAVLGGCGIGRPFDIAIANHPERSVLIEVLGDWAGDRYPICAVTVSNSRRDTGKTRAYLEFFRAMLTARSNKDDPARA